MFRDTWKVHPKNSGALLTGKEGGKILQQATHICCTCYDFEKQTKITFSVSFVLVLFTNYETPITHRKDIKSGNNFKFIRDVGSIETNLCVYQQPMKFQKIAFPVHSVFKNKLTPNA